jgi:hypothetical protein
MKRFVSLAAAGLLCGASVVGATGVAGVAGASVRPLPGIAIRGTDMRLQPGGLMYKVPGYSANAPTVSENWSGDAALGAKKFNSVHSVFVQPAVKCDGKPLTITSNWVGIDGYNNQTVEQDGTFGFCGGKTHMTPQYVAWYEMYPGPSADVFAVHPGDIIDVSVNYSNGNFTMAETDETTGKTASTTASNPNAERDSAEWIIERPAYCNSSGTKCELGALADYDTTTMSGATASVDGGNVENVGAFRNYPIFMIDPITRGFISLDTVGALSGPSFTATWDRTGTPTPISLSPKG